MVDKSYELCLYQCNENENGMIGCKQSCFKNIMVPFRHSTHIARDGEEVAYRRCLGQRETFPNLAQEDFIQCSNNLYHDRVKVLTDKFADEAQKIFTKTRSQWWTQNKRIKIIENNISLFKPNRSTHSINGKKKKAEMQKSLFFNLWVSAYAFCFFFKKK